MYTRMRSGREIEIDANDFSPVIRRSPDSNHFIAHRRRSPAEDAIKIDMLGARKKGGKGERNARETRSRSRDAIRYMENVAMRAASRVGIVILHGCAR